MALYQRDAVSVNIGERLRELREERNISMRSLATRSGLSANALSMIERGKASPSVSTLYKLAEALGISITTFFASATDRKQVVFLKADERTRMSFQRGIFEGLGGEQFVGRVEPFMLTLENSASSGGLRTRRSWLSWGSVSATTLIMKASSVPIGRPLS